MPDPAGMPYWPRALREQLAAQYCGLSATTFRQVVMPSVAPVQLTTGRVAWLREDLDAWLDRLKPSARAAVVDGTPADDNAAPPEPPHARNPIAAGLANLPPPRRKTRPNAPR